MERIGYTNAQAEKLEGQWSVRANNPLEEKSVYWSQIGSSVQQALAAVATIPSVPRYYLCGHSFSCRTCAHYGQPIGYTENGTGNFMHRCVKCKSTWIAQTASEQEVHAKEIMNEALYEFR